MGDRSGRLNGRVHGGARYQHRQPQFRIRPRFAFPSREFDKVGDPGTGLSASCVAMPLEAGEAVGETWKEVKTEVLEAPRLHDLQ